MLREDYVMRLIRQIGEFLASIVGRRERGDFAGALVEAGQAWNRNFEVPRELADSVDTPTLASLLRHADVMRAAADLFWEEARNYQGQGDPLTAFARHRRALELYLEARAADPRLDDDSAILELSRHVHARDLDPRYR